MVSGEAKSVSVIDRDGAGTIRGGLNKQPVADAAQQRGRGGRNEK